MALCEHLEKLRHFHRLANHRSLRQGALAMGISQAGLSKSIASLEAVLEVQLFLRSKEGLLLTKEGQEVLAATETILNESARLELKLRTLKVSKAPSRLNIGMYDSIAVYFFADLKSYLENLYPDVDLQMIVDTSSNLSSLVHSAELDIAIGVNLDRNAKESVEFFKLFDDHYSFYISSRHGADSGKLPLLIHGRSEDHNGKSVENYLSTLIKKIGAHRAFNFETLKSLTTQGVGIGVLPTQVAKPLVQKGALNSIQIPRTRNLFGLHNIGFLATKEFLEFHRSFAEDIYRLGSRWAKN